MGTTNIDQLVSRSHDIYVLVAHLLARGLAYSLLHLSTGRQNNVHTRVAPAPITVCRIILRAQIPRDVGVQILHEQYYTLNIHQGHTGE